MCATVQPSSGGTYISSLGLQLLLKQMWTVWTIPEYLLRCIQARSEHYKPQVYPRALCRPQTFTLVAPV